MEINKIYCEDALEFMQKIPDNFVTIGITSPPYNLGKDALSGGGNKKNYDEYSDDKTMDEYSEWIKKIITENIRITKYHFFLNIQENKGNKGIINFIFREFNENIKEVFIWAKKNPPSHIIDTQCSNGYEYIFCFSKDNPESKTFNYCNFSNHRGDYIKNILISNVNSENNNHSFAFPKFLPRFFIKNFSREGDLVFDCFMGSGTTAVVAKELSRGFLGCDISKVYVEICNKRLEQKNLISILDFS